MKPLALALSVVCLVFVAAACGGADGAKSAGPVPSVSLEAEPPALAAESVPATSARVGFVGLPPGAARRNGDTATLSADWLTGPASLLYISGAQPGHAPVNVESPNDQA